MTEVPSTLTDQLALVTVAGPDSRTLVLEPPGPLTIGRRSGHDLQLTDPASRDHAILVREDRRGRGLWYLIDTESKHGTRLNGIPVLSGRRYPIQPGDLIEITPWTFQFVDPAARKSDASVVRTFDDAEAERTINLIDTDAVPDPAQRRLALLLQCAEAIHQAHDEASLAEAVLDAALTGTGYSNAAFLKPMTVDGTISVVSQRGKAVGDPSNPRLSRSLIRNASGGSPARLARSRDQQMVPGVSIVELGIDEALCVPITLGRTVAGFLYLDSRIEDSSTAPIASDAADFAIGIGRIAAMALANIMRMDLQRRSMQVEADLRATGEAQRMVLPQREMTFGALRYVGESRPGRLISGDFFDAIRLDEHRLAVTIGDVVGKGIAASVLMTTSHGFLHAALREHPDPARAVNALNRFIKPRCKPGSFVTLWLGILDTQEQSLHYADIGHGYAILQRSDGTQEKLVAGGGIPVGIDGDATYESAHTPWKQGDRLLIVSDGLVEQVGGRGTPQDGKQFGIGSLQQILQQQHDAVDHITAIFAAIEHHAGTARLADDATAVMVEWP